MLNMISTNGLMSTISHIVHMLNAKSAINCGSTLTQTLSHSTRTMKIHSHSSTISFQIGLKKSLKQYYKRPSISLFLIRLVSLHSYSLQKAGAEAAQPPPHATTQLAGTARQTSTAQEKQIRSRTGKLSQPL